MITHYPVSALALGPQYNQASYAIWARKPTGKAVVFIHGYSGHATATWSEFHKLIPETPEFAGCDFIFYGHDGLYGTTAASATLFYEFLDRLFTQTGSLTIPCLGDLQIRRGLMFSKVILAAHSLGAVICRWSLLFARRQHRDWMNKTAMVLYAPAHRGATPSEMIRELGVGPTWLSEILSKLGLVARYASPLIDELDPNCAQLQDLQKETHNALAQGDSPYLIAHKVVIADRERVVKNLQFEQDPWPPTTFAGTTHTSVCKPNLQFLFPLDVLSEAL